MNPLAVSALSSLIIWLLTFGSGWLVNHGVWTQADATTYVSAAALGILSLAWAQRNVIRNYVKVLVALMPGIHTMDDVNAHIAAKLPTPSLTTPSSTSPGVPDVGSIDPKRFVGPGAAVLLACALGVGLMTGCAPPPPNLTPQATQAFKNTRAINALDLLRDTAVSANAQVPPLVTTARTRQVVAYHESALKIIHAAGSGWQAAVLTGLDEAMKDATPSEQQTLGPYVALVKTLLTEIPK